MPAAFVRRDTNVTSAVNTGLAVTLGGGYAAGTSVFVVVGIRTAAGITPSTYTCTDTAGNVYTQDHFSATANLNGYAMFSSHNIKALVTGNTISITAPSNNKLVVMTNNFSGLGAATLDQKQQNPAHTVASPNAATYTSNATPTTTQANDFLFGGIMLHIDIAGTITPTTGWTTTGAAVGTTGGSAGANASVWAQFREVTATGAYTSNPTGTARNYRSGIVAYKIAAAPVATAPTVTTQAATNVASTSATGNGNVTADGGGTIIERGFVVGEGGITPTIATNSGRFIVTGTTGAFSGSMTGLGASTPYSYRAYATNSAGTSYGASQPFTTTAGGAGTTGRIKVQTASGFVAKPVKVWNGTAWVTKPLKRWNGAAWVTTNY